MIRLVFLYFSLWQFLLTLQEQELISSLQAGDQQAFKILIEQQQDRVYNTLAGMLHQSELAEDLTQEVFIEVHRSIGRFKGDSALSTWVYRIAVNKALEWLRKQKRKKRAAHVLSIFGTTDSGVMDIPDYNPSGLSLEQQDRAKALFKAMQKLSDNQRAAITLYFFEELSYKEIAKVLDSSLAAVESWIHRGKKQLKKHLVDFYQKDLD